MTDQDNFLKIILEFCSKFNFAESSFGRKVVNDGKFISRLRSGSRVTPETWAKVANFIENHSGDKKLNINLNDLHLIPKSNKKIIASKEEDIKIMNSGKDSDSSKKDFRFFDNRQKYLLFVSTCNEKEIVSKRVGMELDHIHPQPPALRIFDAGMGDGSVLAGVMREMHHKFPTLPFYVAGKEISLEDVRISLSKMADRLYEHPATVLVFTNLLYSEAPWLKPRSLEAANAMVWKEVSLLGDSSHQFEEQLNGLRDFLSENWKAEHSKKTGNPIYQRPTVLVVYRNDHKFLLNNIIPKQEIKKADYDLVIASQPYRLRVSSEIKSKNVILPLVRSLREGGRLIGIHSAGSDPGHEIIRKIWPKDILFSENRHNLLSSLKTHLGSESANFNIKANSDSRSLFKYIMHSLPSELEASIGTSTLFAAWNAATYVAQIEDQRIEEAMKSSDYMAVTQDILKKHGGLWFNDESFTVSKKML